MCGIAGLIGADAPGADRGELVRRMIQAIAHRGPDGVRIETGATFAFAHARLSIIDLEGGWQPLHAAGITLIGNGEIYNYLELTHAFGLADRLATGSDFEPLLHLYAEFGREALARLRGMYALCLAPGGAPNAKPGGEPPLLARDGFGIKPIYLRDTAQGRLFASEPRALFAADGARPKVDVARAEELLALNYTLGSDTIMQGARRMAPGDVRTGEVGPGAVGASERTDAASQGFVATVHAPTPVGEAEALLKLDAVLEDSVRVHQRSDVPYGLFLSGGVDSASIATLMSRLNSRPVMAFTCSFDAPGASNERAAAEKIARALDLDWRETRFGAEDFWRIAPQVAWALDDPTTDFATLPTYRLAEAAKGDLTVVLTGEGGDELFGGYGRYRRALRPGWLGGRAAEPQIHAPYLGDGGAGALARWRRQTAPAAIGLTRLQRAQAADMAAWLPNDLLLKLDRCLMAHGMEGRTPFLDREVADFAFHLPDRLKVRRRRGKWLLRRWLARHCPAADAWGRKKGFTVPVASWIAPRARAIGPRIAANEGVRQVCDAGLVRRVFDDDDLAASRWPLMFYALWWTIHIGAASVAEAGEAVLGFN